MCTSLFIWKRAIVVRVNEVDVLEREAKEMEVQLKALQNRMQQQQLEDDAVVKTGGCRWKSARPDKGTVLSYAKDVQDKYRSKYGVGEDPVLRAPPETIRLAVPNTNVSKTTMLPQQNPSSFRQKGTKTNTENRIFMGTLCGFLWLIHTTLPYPLFDFSCL